MTKSELHSLPENSPNRPVANTPAKRSSYEKNSELRFLESTVNWIAQDSRTRPNQYLEDCNTQICGE
jgi:hypothetical protein